MSNKIKIQSKQKIAEAHMKYDESRELYKQISAHFDRDLLYSARMIYEGYLLYKKYFNELQRNNTLDDEYGLNFNSATTFFNLATSELVKITNSTVRAIKIKEFLEEVGMIACTKRGYRAPNICKSNQKTFARTYEINDIRDESFIKSLEDIIQSLHYAGYNKSSAYRKFEGRLKDIFEAGIFNNEYYEGETGKDGRVKGERREWAMQSKKIRNLFIYEDYTRTFEVDLKSAVPSFLATEIHNGYLNGIVNQKERQLYLKLYNGDFYTNLGATIELNSRELAKEWMMKLINGSESNINKFNYSTTKLSRAQIGQLKTATTKFAEIFSSIYKFILSYKKKNSITFGVSLIKKYESSIMKELLKDSQGCINRRYGKDSVVIVPIFDGADFYIRNDIVNHSNIEILYSLIEKSAQKILNPISPYIKLKIERSVKMVDCDRDCSPSIKEKRVVKIVNRKNASITPKEHEIDKMDICIYPSCEKDICRTDKWSDNSKWELLLEKLESGDEEWTTEARKTYRSLGKTATKAAYNIKAGYAKKSKNNKIIKESKKASKISKDYYMFLIRESTTSHSTTTTSKSTKFTWSNEFMAEFFTDSPFSK